MVENLSPCPSLPLLSTFVPSSPPFNPVGRRRLCMKRNKRKRTLLPSSLLPLTFLDRQHSITASYLPPLNYIPLTSQPRPHPDTLSSIALPASDIAEVQVGLLYAPVWGDVFGLVAFHVLLHGWQAGAVLQADGALVGRGAVVGAQVLDHGRVVPGSLVAQLALEWLLT